MSFAEKLSNGEYNTNKDKKSIEIEDAMRCSQWIIPEIEQKIKERCLDAQSKNEREIKGYCYWGNNDSFFFGLKEQNYSESELRNPIKSFPAHEYVGGVLGKLPNGISYFNPEDKNSRWRDYFKDPYCVQDKLSQVMFSGLVYQTDYIEPAEKWKEIIENAVRNLGFENYTVEVNSFVEGNKRFKLRKHGLLTKKYDMTVEWTSTEKKYVIFMDIKW